MQMTRKVKTKNLSEIQAVKISPKWSQKIAVLILPAISMEKGNSFANSIAPKEPFSWAKKVSHGDI